jgi:GT2 family glycosyltransferase
MTIALEDIGRRIDVVLVTVTYGDRIRYLSQLLDRAMGTEGVYKAVVVNNATMSDLSQLKAKWGERVSIIDLDSNTGSANGYAIGIRAALIHGAEYIWLMDDDNAPAEGALSVLRRELSSLSDEIGISRAAVLGFRSSRMKTLGDLRRNFAPPSSFVGFHASQISQKLARLVGRRRPDRPARADSVEVPYSPYGGFLAHRLVFQHLGLPRKDFVLYADDWEYTMRLTRKGGRIRLITGAAIEDLESSWNQKREQPSIFFQSLVLGSDFRVYYTFRNHVWLSRNVLCASRFVYRLNKFLFLSLLSFFAVMRRKGRRLDLIRRAVADGERGALGINPKFPMV